MSIRRVALIYDDKVRPDTTGTHCRSALEEMVDVEHFHPSEVDGMPCKGFDLYLNIDDGLRYYLPDHLHPKAWWAIDTHMDFQWYKSRAPSFDFVFAAQLDGARRLTENGITNVHWLPLACNPAIHHKHDVAKEHNICFVGRVAPGPRQQLLALIKKHFSNVLIGQRYLDEMARAYSASRIIFNRSVKYDLNMRVFEAMACGSLLLTNALPDSGQDDLFENGVHLATYNSSDELLDKADYYLRHEDERERIATAGREAVLKSHTYRHRMEEMLHIIEKRSAVIDSDVAAGPRTAATVLVAGGFADATRFIDNAGLNKEPVSKQDQCIQNKQRVTGAAKGISYFEYSRPEVLALVPNSAKRVLDVGCGSGRLGGAIKARQAATVIGVEINEQAAASARARLNEVIVGDVETLDKQFREASFDCIICADVLEHMFDPHKFLRQARKWLRDDGCLIASIPNVRHHSVVRSLLAGNWTYQSEGLLDETHLHFFTRRGIEDLFHSADYETIEWRAVPAPGEEDLFEKIHDHKIQLGKMVLQGLSADDVEEFLAYQYLCVAKGAFVHHCYQGNNGCLPASGENVSELLGVAKPQTRDHIPESAKKILYISHEASLAAEQLTHQYRTFVTGTAIDEQAAAEKTISFEQIAEDYREEDDANSPIKPPFDCIVLHRTLENSTRPDLILRTARKWLTDKGRLILEVANVCHHQTVSSLMSGTWSPSMCGRGNDSEDSISRLRPLRFFTRREIEKLLYRAGFTATRYQAVSGPGYDQWNKNGRPGKIDLGPLQIADLSESDAEEFYASHWIVDAEPANRSDYSLTSIVILTHNQLPYTHECLESIARYTDGRHEVIVVDNGSTDGTLEYLRHRQDIKLIANIDNLGFAKGSNQGMRAARGDNVLLLNNDVVVTSGWLDRLLRALHSGGQIGIVGPVSNNISGMQAIPVSYESLCELDGFAWQHGKANDGRRIVTDRLVGFCMLIKREVIDKIGFLDEQFEVGCYEDDDYCRRATAAGYQLIVAADSFVHHFGSRTFMGNDIDMGKAMRENEKRFRAKWNKQDTKGYSKSAEKKSGNTRGNWRLEESPGGGLLLKPEKIRLSLCMIVRDNADTIVPCLESIKPWVDEMVIVDTGSKDNTAELVRQRGARLYRFPWCDDFSAARNESLKHARGEWLFWMDSDDTIDAENGRKLRQLADREHDPSVLGHVMQVHCPGGREDGRDDVTVVDHVKLIRNRPDLRFECRIHEQVLPAIRRAGGEVNFTDIFVVHSGSDHSPEARRRKLERDFRLLKLELKDRPDHPFAWFNLGMTHADAGEHAEAVAALRRSIEVSQPSESHVRKAYALLIGSLSQLSRHEEAWQTCSEARRHYPQDIELLFREGVLHQHFKRYEQAEKAYLAALDNHEPRHFSSIDRGITGYKAYQNLAIVYEDMGRADKAEAQWQKVVEKAPDYPCGWQGLGDTLLRQKKCEEALRLVQRIISDQKAPDAVQVEAMILKGRLAAAEGDLQKAKNIFHNAIERWPQNTKIRHALCRILFEQVDPLEAEEPLKDLLDVDPQDASAYHNLGIVYLRLGRCTEAAEAFRKSLRHRPESPDTYRQLSNALDACGRTDEANSARRQAERLGGQHPQTLITA